MSEMNSAKRNEDSMSLAELIARYGIPEGAESTVNSMIDVFDANGGSDILQTIQRVRGEEAANG